MTESENPFLERTMFVLIGLAIGGLGGASIAIIIDPNSQKLAQATADATAAKRAEAVAEANALDQAEIAKRLRGELATLRAAQSMPVSPVEPKPTVHTSPKPIEISAGELYSAYNRNEVAADQRYNGRRLRVTGTVDNIGKDLLDSPYVTFLWRQDSLGSVQCLFKYENSVARLSKGQRIRVIGECAGKTLGNVILRNCEID